MNQGLRIKLYSYDHKLLDQSIKKIIEVAKSTNAEIKGPIPLPTKKEIFTILRSPHVNKSSREQFERRIHKRLLIISNVKQETMDKLKRLSIPTSVEIKIKL
ncbi:MAG: 30S ribosomal protein S10 [Ureaplasma sp.]|nr:30S ribosomal protein S10 [Ureaplasma sp.]MDE5651717.1 30S ribosomal protein S10 [Ureaplasma sp.]MDE7221750.1 30S ribosomal protein S10 [Ureaplasma sp.]